MASYQWTGPNGFSSTAQNPVITGVQGIHAGTYTLSVTQQGCGTASTTSSVQVGVSPTSVNFSSNSPICVGQNLVLTADNVTGVSYLWSGPNGYTSSLSSNTITGAGTISSGIYSLTIGSIGCTPVNQQVPGTVNELILAGAGVSTTPLCEGNVMNLTANTIPSGTYSWSGPGGFVSTAQNPSISQALPSNSGVYTLNTTQPGCGTQSGTVSVTVGASLSGIVGGSNSPVCVGGNLNLTALNRSGVNYSWTGPGGYTSNLANNSITNITTSVAGNYVLQISSPGCGSQSNVVKVVVNNPTGISVSSNSPVCSGSVLQLNSVGPRGSSFSWTGPNGFVSTAQSPSLANATVPASGIYTVIVNDPTCGPVQLTTSVTVGANLNTAQALSNSPVCETGTLNLTATALSGATYSWSGPNGFTSSISTVSITPVGTINGGTYSVTVSTPGCLPVVRTNTVVVNPPVMALPGSSSPACQGSVLYLYGNVVTGANYQWQGPGGYVSTSANPSLSNVQPVRSGIYTYTISSTNCGVSSGTTSVLVGSSLGTINVTSNSPACVGNQLNLSSTLVSSGTVNWSGPNGFTSSIQNPVLPGVQLSAGGVYTYVASSAGCGSVTRTIPVVVNTAPILNAGSNSPVCQGNVLSLTVNTISGSTYSWSGPSSFVSTVQNPSISNAQPTRTGIYTLSVNSSSCGITTTTTSVTVNSSLTSISTATNSPVCVGNTLNLSVTNRIGYNYSWSGPTGFTSTQGLPVITGAGTGNAGRYTVVISSAGCGSTTLQTNVVSVNNPASVTASGTSPVCVGGVVYFTGVAPGGSTYSWSGPAGFVSSVKNPSRSNVQLTQAGAYTMSSNVPGCGVVTTTATITVNTCRQSQSNTDVMSGTEVSGNESDMDVSGTASPSPSVLGESYGKLIAWPNPNSGDVVVLKWEGLTGDDRTITVRIFDATGREVLLKSVDYDLSGTAVEELAFPARLSKGLYTIETVHDDRFVYTKLIIE
jgi:hypothetical protein